MTQENLFPTDAPQPTAAPAQDPRPCTRCNATGETERGKCLYCDGRKTFPTVDVAQLCEAIKGKKGLRSKAPDHYGSNYTIENRRAYYVWRMARFHGGQDVTMPITASTLIHGDPWTPELDQIADVVARKVYGTDRAAAYRWGNALGHSLTVPDGQPASAYSSGPVLLDNNKPEEELPELY